MFVFKHIQKLPRVSAKFPECLQNFQSILKLSTVSRYYLDFLEVLRLSVNFLGCHELSKVPGNFLMSGISGVFEISPDYLESREDNIYLTQITWKMFHMVYGVIN